MRQNPELKGIDMRRSLFASVLVVVAALLGGVLVACGGGGDKGGVVRGVANVNSETLHGRVGIGHLANPYNSDSEMLTDTSCGLPRSPAGWTDQPFACPLPAGVGNRVWAIYAFNDLNGNNVIDGSAEFLGACDYYLVWSSATGKFVVVDTNSNIEYADASASTTSLYIDCAFAYRSIDVDAKDVLLPLKQKVTALMASLH